MSRMCVVFEKQDKIWMVGMAVCKVFIQKPDGALA